MRLLFVIVVMIGAASAHAAIIRVPSQIPSIQAAIDSASTGDTVLLADGGYLGSNNTNLTLNKNIVLTSENGPEVTLIDRAMSAPGPILRFASPVDSTTIIDGITFTGAYGSPDSGALYGAYSSPSISNCILKENECSGMVFYDYSPLISNCLITNNAGNGIYIDHPYPPIRINESEISENGAAGVFIGWSGGIEMDQCLVRDNGQEGLLIITVGENFWINNCTFVGNQSGMTFWFNYPRTVAAPTQFDSAGVLNSIFAFNERGLTVDPTFTNYSIVRCNNAYGNSKSDFWIDGVDTTISFGNISVDPLFCDYVSHDLSVSRYSPCSPDHNSCGLLMGAFPVDSSCVNTCCIGVTGNIDCDPDQLVDIGDLTLLVDYLFISGSPLCCSPEADIDGEGAIDVGDLTRLIGYLFIDAEANLPAGCL